MDFLFAFLILLAAAFLSGRHLDFGKELSPYEVQKKLKELITSSNIQEYTFSEVVVVHRNDLVVSSYQKRCSTPMNCQII